MNKVGSKHLSLEQRQIILRMIENGSSLRDIAATIGKDHRAISREVQNRREMTERENSFGSRHERYSKPCKRCSRFPFVCNGCPNKKNCMYLLKFHYKPEEAHANYKFILKDARVGLNLTPEQFTKLDTTLYHGVSKGQSIFHIFANNEDLPVSMRSAYRYVDLKLLSVNTIDLRRKVRLRRRTTSKKKKFLIDAKIRINRLFTDFIRFMAHNPGVPVTQIDLIESPRPISHSLLTIHFTSIRFMLAFPLIDKTSESVTQVFRMLQDTLTAEEYKKLFNVIVTDRGAEFSNPTAIEVHHETGEVLAHVFYCDPQASNQKAQIEENHTILRFILPKGTNLSFLDTQKTNLMMSHINSYCRAILNNSPIELFKIYYGEELLNKLKIRAIDPDSVYLKPDLFCR